ncbi:ATPase synthesis protein 25, mitochondrial [Fulvia fulva]|uniref:ATPase synthesis protein 25 n=1 Tax=Passalora fulva TaxID=5499 RepID=A0A9Q8PDS2_PASFU|nr:ATPase synthesis protein 25, mitochondrial [Fulvia fulva]KAK4617869.1 ATPase synthesis protein 25, mitochondrial [Fulvia fulva]KAK4619282.1 ATPase synthesis protein 25, mitochondrial [Fulvia fulva]UJO20608.1 ATPase synthesis protein 25, mitochondrial [Fulvia fulva]WPV17809.1 ATPase synthesis protein 25, mitochondrial [Fulvia fulva]WPV33076.1 ATPase synthesis protein 25, mitochondrial [Fulvia fulva]
MAVSRTAAKVLTCSGCRPWMLPSFIASIGGPTLQHPPPPRRAFSTQPRRWNEALERLQKEAETAEHALNDINVDFKNGAERQKPAEAGPPPETEHPSPPPSQPQQEAFVPWYLHIDSPMPPRDNAISARQRRPDLPEHPPALLQPLLERISVELGMDDLSLLDLRGIDPPPALGSNLLMIVGTARSDKHLHFSADKLCRWLRTEYKLRPVADGLLGRQELKLKLRRRAKKSRLLSAVGAKQTADTELEEGIRTGWVCVNVGRVEGGDIPKTEEQLAREEKVVGFGTGMTGTNIVVQLLTEEKRGEVELERLWTAVLKKSKKEQDDIRGGGMPEEAASTETDEPHISTSSKEPAQPGLLGRQETLNNLTMAHSPGHQHQVRAYHTSARRLQVSSTQLPVGPSDPPSDVIDPDNITDRDRILIELDSRLEELEDMSEEAALDALGPAFMLEESNPTPFSDNDTTPDLASFYRAMPSCPDRSHWHAYIQLLCHAQRLRHPNVNANNLTAALEQMQLASLVPMEKTYLAVLVALLRDVRRTNASDDAQLTAVFDLLEDMEHHGHDALKPEILELLYHVLVGPPASSGQSVSLQSLVPALGLVRPRKQVQDRDTSGFWRTWHSYPRRMLPRDKGMYTLMFDFIAEDKLQLDFKQAREVIATCLVDMEVEQPQVLFDGGEIKLAMSVLKALRRIDSNGEVRDWDDARSRSEDTLRRALNRT